MGTHATGGRLACCPSAQLLHEAVSVCRPVVLPHAAARDDEESGEEARGGTLLAQCMTQQRTTLGAHVCAAERCGAMQQSELCSC